MAMSNVCLVAVVAVTSLVTMVTCLKTPPNISPDFNELQLKLQDLITMKTEQYMTLNPLDLEIHPLKRSMQTVDALLNIPLTVLCRVGKRSGQVKRTVCPLIVRSTRLAEAISRPRRSEMASARTLRLQQLNDRP